MIARVNLSDAFLNRYFFKQPTTPVVQQSPAPTPSSVQAQPQQQQQLHQETEIPTSPVPPEQEKVFTSLISKCTHFCIYQTINH